LFTPSKVLFAYYVRRHLLKGFANAQAIKTYKEINVALIFFILSLHK